jgi:hypothetical protein
VIAFLLLLSGVAAYADEGIALEVVNKTGKELTVKMVISSWDGSREIDRTVAKDETVHFAKSETMHKEGVMLPTWEITFHGTCAYVITSKDGQCPVQTGKSSCANISDMGDSCSLRFVVAE